MTGSSDMSAKEIFNDFNENYGKVRKLLDEDSKNDPEHEPYVSKYKAKNILVGMRDSLKNILGIETPVDEIALHAMLGTVLLNIGIIDMETEELTASEKVLSEAVELLVPNASKPEIVIVLIYVCNNLGILWSNREEPGKAKTYLLNSKELYENFKCTMQLPLPIEQIVSPAGDSPIGDIMILEKAHTLTLYYLAQVYGALKENLKSAVYCHVTLRRQLQYNNYEPIDWALNSATLSQFFAEQNGFYQSRHHLAAASTILEQYEENLRCVEGDEVSMANMETFRHRSADVARCWAKYCIILMTASKARLMGDSEELTEAITDLSNLALEDNENICGGDLRKLTFPDLDVSKYENKIGDKYLLTFDDAKVVFLCCQDWLNKAKEYYKLDSLASDYIELIQDSSQSYSYLAFFEEDDKRRAKMLKRRVDMIEELLKHINPVYYLQHCRQLWYELGEVYTDILNIKLEEFNKTERTTPHALKKINNLCEKSMESYENFLNSVKDKDGKLPKKLASDMIRPVISAYAFIGRSSMKRVAAHSPANKPMLLTNIQKSYKSYQAVVDICMADEEAALMMQEEFQLCQQMVEILPIKIKRLQLELMQGN
ncbi:unnamed protein product [Chrysodeixis includens]|uniref:KIF-binding protein n=1 Tax=Chrysodeixis includens TaxID=689277 RepID=A0A9N8KUV8_CHRIL|nr:unnamed protein product [Chrysodeixis includens]